MQTKSYTDLFALIEALCGVTFAANETGKIKALINRRATKAYRATNYWPRFLVVGEERAVSSSVVPYDETDLSSIDTFLRIHTAAPWISASVQEYEYTVGSAGAKLIAGGSDPTSAFVTFKAQHTATYGTGGSDTADVPAEWFEYMAHGTYADFLRAEGQQEKAALADQEADMILTDELLRVDEQHGTGIISQRIFTNSNMQIR